ncbi:MAG TPA: AAA family ATPase [Steroidobacteraceae bacterium]|nr:AAA family ATPase [Steroidobacteraceae bacterium]
MYLSFFGLNEKPFAITPDPRYLYLSERHAEALAHLLYGINEAGGFVQLTGEVGTGKTTVVRSLLAQTPQNAEIALILNPRMTAPEFLLTICEELGIGVPDYATESLKDLVDILSHYLLRAHAAGKRIVLVVDEAQNLAPEVLEQVRLLTNLETNTQKLLQIILIGQPELREILARTELRQLAQRITGRYHLCPLLRQETAAYVRHRLRVAGATSDIFTTHALSEVHRLSGGVPRVINVICDRALLAAYTQDRHHATARMVHRSAEEVFGRRLLPWWLPWGAAAATVVVLALGAVTLWQFGAEAIARGHIRAFVVRHDAAASVSHGADPAAASTRGAAGTLSSVAQLPSGASEASQPALAQLLAAHSSETDPDSAFGKLFALWGAHYVAGNVDPCTQAVQQGLECFVQHGSLAQLRLYNRPAILMVTDDAGMPHQIVLSGLDDEQARVDLGGPRAVGLLDLSRYWFGDFVLLWRPRTHHIKPLSLGMRGDDVRELREHLELLRGMKPSQPESDVFDAELGQLVRQFQRTHRLAVDGVAGLQTLVVLNSATAEPHTPVLFAANVHGS